MNGDAAYYDTQIDGHHVRLTPKTGTDGTEYYLVTDLTTGEEYEVAPTMGGFQDRGLQAGGLSQEIVEQAIDQAQQHGF